MWAPSATILSTRDQDPIRAVGTWIFSHCVLKVNNSLDVKVVVIAAQSVPACFMKSHWLWINLALKLGLKFEIRAEIGYIYFDFKSYNEAGRVRVRVRVLIRASLFLFSICFAWAGCLNDSEGLGSGFATKLWMAYRILVEWLLQLWRH